MMGKKKLSEIKAQLANLSAHPPKVEAAEGGPQRIVKTLEALCAELERVAKKPRKPKARQRQAKR
jgi:vacuolar-type H+-ATPase subunit I/STV1